MCLKNKRKEIIKKELEEVVKDFEEVSADNISYLIQSKKNSYIIYLDIENDLDWYLDDKEEKKLEKGKFDPLVAKVNSMEHKPSVLQMSKKMKRQYMCLLGNALILAMENNFKEAEKHLKEAQNYILEREYEITRKWNAQMSAGIFSALAIVYFVVGFFFLKGESEKAFWDMLWYGAIGVLLSILQHNAYINAKCTAGKGLVFWEIVSKYIVGMISAVIVINAFNAGIFMTGFVTAEYKQQFILLIGIVAGFSERLAPSLIEKIEGGKSIDEEENFNNIKSRENR